MRVHPSSQDILLTPGLVHQANGGVLILSAATMLSQFDLWQRLKHILQTQTLIGIQLIHLKPCLVIFQVIHLI